MTYAEARACFDEVAKYGSVLGLASIKELLGRLGNPQNHLKFIHIAGTNGKGSVLAYLSTVLTAAGYRTGRYISPTLFSYREKIQVDGEYISEADLGRLAEPVIDAANEMMRDGFSHPTVFEMETALSFLYFKEKTCDLVVLEVGMGGRTDATNVITTTVLSVLTSISMDHMAFLGDSLEKIAANKAGIIKPGVPVVTAAQQPEALRVIETEAEKMHAPLTVSESKKAYDISYGLAEQHFSYKEYTDLTIRLAGKCQIENACLAVDAVRVLNTIGYPVSPEQLKTGLLKTVWRGRFTVLSSQPMFLIDGAHNRDAAEKLRQSLELYFPGRRIFFIMGVFGDKEYEEIIKITAPLAYQVIATQTPDNPRALPADKLANAWRRHTDRVSCQPDLALALKESLKMADQEEDVIIAFGSLSHLSAVEKALEEAKTSCHDGSGKN